MDFRYSEKTNIDGVMIKRRRNPERGESEDTMKKMFEDVRIAVIFMAACTAIAAIMGLIEAHDKKKQDKRRPLKPTRVFIYTAEWIRRITKTVAAPFRRHRDHLVWFEDGVHRLSPEMVAAVKAAPHYTIEELEKACNSSPKIAEQNLETILI